MTQNRFIWEAEVLTSSLPLDDMDGYWAQRRVRILARTIDTALEIVNESLVNNEIMIEEVNGINLVGIE